MFSPTQKLSRAPTRNWSTLHNVNLGRSNFCPCNFDLASTQDSAGTGWGVSENFQTGPGIKNSEYGCPFRAIFLLSPAPSCWSWWGQVRRNRADSARKISTRTFAENFWAARAKKKFHTIPSTRKIPIASPESTSKKTTIFSGFTASPIRARYGLSFLKIPKQSPKWALFQLRSPPVWL